MLKAKRILKAALNVLLTLFLLFAVVITVLAFAAQSNSARIPSLGGKCILTVLSPSMEPTIMTGDIIISNKITLEDAEKLEANTVVTFSVGDLNGDGIDDVNTHRIVEVTKDDNGKTTYVTKGDNNQQPDTDTVSPEQIISVWDGTRIAGAGNVLDYLQHPTGFLLVIVLPLLAFFIYEIIVFVKKYVEVKSEGKKVISVSEEEEIKRKAIEEYLRSQSENSAADTETATDYHDEAKTEE
jgi:signal peptidase